MRFFFVVSGGSAGLGVFLVWSGGRGSIVGISVGEVFLGRYSDVGFYWLVVTRRDSFGF